jgi:uncharacterized protein (TIGR02301 family)
VPRLYQASVLLAAFVLAQPVMAQPRSQSVSDLAFALGQSHALRQLCQGATDQYWRERMERMIELEAPNVADRPPLTERFNDGFLAGRRQYPRCTQQSRAAERSAAARGGALATLLARGMASR